MNLVTFAALLAGPFASPLVELDARNGNPSCSVNCSKVQSRCAKPTQMASVTKYCSAYLILTSSGSRDSPGIPSTVYTTVTSTITSTTTNFQTSTSTAPAQTVTKSTTLYAEVTSFIATSTSTVYTSTITGTSTTIVNAPDITRCAVPNLQQKRDPEGEAKKCREKKPRCFSRQHKHEQITSACKCFSLTAGPGGPDNDNDTPVTSTVTSFTTVVSAVQSGSITTLTPTITTLLPTTSTSTKSLTSTTTLSTVTTASVTSTRYAVATAAYKNAPFRILASGGTVTGKYLLTPNPAGDDFFSKALLVFAANTSDQATTFTYDSTSNALQVADSSNPAFGYAATILGSGVADKLRAQNFAFQDEEAITCGVFGGPGETCVLECTNPFDRMKESFEDCYQGDKNWMVGQRAGADYGSCPLVTPYLVTG